jgi:hypothetical protein
MEPTSGLEPLTCRLRIDPVLRMLLCDMDHTGAFCGVFVHSGGHFYSTWYSSMIEFRFFGDSARNCRKDHHREELFAGNCS